MHDIIWVITHKHYFADLESGVLWKKISANLKSIRHILQVDCNPNKKQIQDKFKILYFFVSQFIASEVLS